MNITCPSCGADMDLDVLLAHEESRQALGKLAMLTLPLAKRTLQYIRLFKPATRAMSHGRTVTLIGELLPDLQRGAITHKGREWRATPETWSLAFDRILERRDGGKLVLPLKSHVYLYEIVVGIVDTAEAVVENDVEASRRTGARHDVAPELQPNAAVPAVPAVLVVPPTLQPSAYARKLRAQIEADRQRRDTATQADDGVPS